AAATLDHLERRRYDLLMSLPAARCVLFCALGLLLSAVACSGPTLEERAKEAEGSAKKSLLSIDHDAYGQKIDPAEVKKVQEQLTALNEYMGPVNGKLDTVTINAFEAFQRNNDLHPDGMFTRATLSLLEAAAAKRGNAKQG